MAMHVIRNISEKIQRYPFVTITVKQVTVMMHRLDHHLEVYKEFLGAVY